MSVNKWSATEQTLTTLAGVDREAINSLSQEITEQGEKIDSMIDCNVVLPKFVHFDTTLDTNVLSTNSISCAILDGTDLYFTKHYYLYKYDVSNELKPVFKAKCKLNTTWGKTARGIVIKDDYIYMNSRLATSSYPTDGEISGGVMVVKKSDLTLANEYPIYNKGTGVHLDTRGHLVSLEQMRGFTIYDISANDGTITELSHVDYPRDSSNIQEIHDAKFIDKNDKNYMIAIGFGDGIKCYDITDVANPTLLWHYSFKNISILKGKYHTMHAVLKDNMLYATIAPTAQMDSEDRIEGIIAFDITNIGTIPSEHEFIKIPYKYTVDKTTTSDSQPSMISQSLNYIVENLDTNGLVFFDFKNNKPTFKGCMKIRSDGNAPYVVKCYEDGRLLVTADKQIYIYRGI